MEFEETSQSHYLHEFDTVVRPANLQVVNARLSGTRTVARIFITLKVRWYDVSKWPFNLQIAGSQQPSHMDSSIVIYCFVALDAVITSFFLTTFY